VKNLKLKQKRVVFTALVLIAVSGAIFSWHYKNEEKVLTANGTIEATEIKVCSEVGGALKKIYVQEGDKVKAGDFLAEIDDEQYKIKLDLAQAQLKGTEASLSEVKAGARNQELNAALNEVQRIKAQLAAAEKALAFEQENLLRLNKLYKQGAITKQELDAQELKLNTAKETLKSLQAQKDAAQAQLNLLEAGARHETIDKMSSSVEMASLKAKLAKLNLAKTKITAPASGTIISCNFEEGEIIPPGAEVITLLDTENLWLNSYIPEDQLNQVQKGQLVNLMVDAYPDKVFKGKVEFIAPKPEFTPKSVQTKKDRVNLVFRVKIRVIDGRNKLLPGMPVDVVFPSSAYYGTALQHKK